MRAISIVIPTYEQTGFGHIVLEKLLDSIKVQVCDFPVEVLVSDNSADDLVERVVRDYDWDRAAFEVRYVRNPRRGFAVNFNNAIDLARYDIIKPMCQDDVFLSPDALKAFADTDGWAICNSHHIDFHGFVKRSPQTRFEPGPITRFNTVGMPSVIAFRRSELRFDERFQTIVDLLMYHALYARFGAPRVINDPLIGQRFWWAHTSANLDNGREEMEEALRLYRAGELMLSHPPHLD